MASILRQLKDEDLEQVHHLIRRDALNDLGIAEFAEKRLGKKLAKTKHARESVIYRYRRSKTYDRWQKKYENRKTDMERQVRLQRERFAVISKLVQGDSDGGFEDLSKSIQARLLTLAAEATDEDLREAASDRGWVANILKIVQASMRDQYRKQVEQLKAELERMLKQPKGKEKKIDPAEIVAQVDKIMGLS